MNCILCGCSEKNLTHFDIGILNCCLCGGMFRIQIEKLDNHLQKFDPKVVNKLKNKKYDIRFWKLISDEYVKYLKLKTSMNFKHVLDVGSLYGTFVKTLNDLGIIAEGIEANENFLKLKVTDKIYHEFFDINYNPHKKYDLITLTQMIYYLPDSFQILNKCHEMLNEDGLIFISTINPESSLIKNKTTVNFAPGVNIFLSKKNYELLENFELLDYTMYNADMFNQMYKNSKISMIKFMIGLKKPYSINPDGNHAFLLLKRI